jgi:hypothetical protein
VLWIEHFPFSLIVERCLLNILPFPGGSCAGEEDAEMLNAQDPALNAQVKRTAKQEEGAILVEH